MRRPVHGLLWAKDHPGRREPLACGVGQLACGLGHLAAGLGLTGAEAHCRGAEGAAWAHRLGKGPQDPAAQLWSHKRHRVVSGFLLGTSAPCRLPRLRAGGCSRDHVSLNGEKGAGCRDCTPLFKRLGELAEFNTGCEVPVPLQTPVPRRQSLFTKFHLLFSFFNISKIAIDFLL